MGLPDEVLHRPYEPRLHLTCRQRAAAQGREPRLLGHILRSVMVRAQPQREPFQPTQVFESEGLVRHGHLISTGFERSLCERIPAVAFRASGIVEVRPGGRPEDQDTLHRLA